MDQPLARAAALAARQHGVLSREQAHAVGVGDNVIGRLVRTGTWRKAHPGVYRFAGAPEAWSATVMAACLAAGKGALASHLTAAALWDLEGFDRPDTVDLSVPAGRRPRVSGVTLHRSGDLDLAKPTRRGGIPVTGLVRTVLDVGATNPTVALRALDGVRRRPYRVPWAALERCLHEHACRGRPGLKAYRAVLEARRDLAPTDSNFESIVFDHLVAAGLPEPVRRYPVLGYWIDGAWPVPKVGVECHSREFHMTDEAFEADPIPTAELNLAGWLILHVTYREFQRHPDRVVDRVRRALCRRPERAAGFDPA